MKYTLINKIFAVFLMLFLCSGAVFYIISDKPEVTEEIAEDTRDLSFEEFFGMSPARDYDEDDDDFRIEVFPSGSGWGYRIYDDEDLVLEQKYIPAQNELVAFSNEKQARSTANLALKKIRQGSIPPKITLTELDSMGVKR